MPHFFVSDSEDRLKNNKFKTTIFDLCAREIFIGDNECSHFPIELRPNSID